MAIFAPISPSASAICKPRPREPPVTSATLPDRSNGSRTPTGHRALIPTPRRGSAESAQGAILERDDHVEAALAGGETHLGLQAAVEHHAAHPAPREAFVRVGAIVQELGGDGGVAQLVFRISREERDEIPGAIEVLEVEVVRRAGADEEHRLAPGRPLEVLYHRLAVEEGRRVDAARLARLGDRHRAV